MRRPVQRLARILACAAAVPAVLAVSGCSSDSGSGDKDAAPSKTPVTASSPTVQKARFSTLPDPCKTLSRTTLKDMVPETDDKSGKAGTSTDTSMRGTCSWSSLDNNGVKGSQFRWLNVSLLRFESDAARGSGDKLAGAYYAKQVAGAKATADATAVSSAPVSGTGDEATGVTYQLKKKEGTFKQQTVVARTANVVVTVDYNGAGLAGEKSPDSVALLKDAKKAAQEAVAAVEAANKA